MSLTPEKEAPPLQRDESGAIRVGQSRVLLEFVIRAFQDGAAAETVVQRYSTLHLADVYATIGYYLRHQDDVHAYLEQPEQQAKEVQNRLSQVQQDLAQIRSQLLA